MSKLLVVVDMQNDFINGSLGTKEAVSIVKNVVEKINKYKFENNKIIFTMDTHFDNYMNTLEGKNLPIPHCIKNTNGWQICDEIKNIVDLNNYKIYEKSTFGSSEYSKDLQNGLYNDIEEVEIIGLCTDICVISNAIITKTFLNQIPVKVDANCCAGVNIQSHNNALEVMKMCQIDIIK